jgi:hypothetical protein
VTKSETTDNIVMRRIIFFLFLNFSLLANGEEEFIFRGEVIAVQKNQASIRIAVTMEKDACKDYLLKDPSGRIAGTFRCMRMNRLDVIPSYPEVSFRQMITISDILRWDSRLAFIQKN